MGQGSSRSSGQHSHDSGPQSSSSGPSSVNTSHVNPSQSTQQDEWASRSDAARLPRQAPINAYGDVSSLAGKPFHQDTAYGEDTIMDRQSTSGRLSDTNNTLDGSNTSHLPLGSSTPSSSMPGMYISNNIQAQASSSAAQLSTNTSPSGTRIAAILKPREQPQPDSTSSNASIPSRSALRTRRQKLAEGFLNMRRRSSQRLSWAFSGGSRASSPAGVASQPESSYFSSMNPTPSGPAVPAVQTISDQEADASMGEEGNLPSQPAATAPRDPYRVMTPPPEEDMMYEERQRARQIVQEALEQLQTELTRSRTPTTEASTSAHPFSPLLTSSLAQTSTNSATESLSSIIDRSQPAASSSMSDIPQSFSNALPSAADPSTWDADSSARRYAPLPRRSASASPTPTSSNVNTPLPIPLAAARPLNNTRPSLRDLLPPPASSSASAAPAPTPSAAPAARPDADELMVPRRILVQGIVASSPPPTPSAALPPAIQVHNDAGNNAESEGLWAELPGHDPSPAGSAARGGSDERVWEDAMAEVLAQVPPHIRNLSERAAEAARLREQANLIGRLLSVAAAATAATLIPGIEVNGAPVAGFGESQSLDALSGSGIPLAPSASAASRNEATSPPQATPRPRSDSLGTFRTPRNATQTTSSTDSTSDNALPGSQASSPTVLQDILRNALAAAFRSANSPAASASESDSTDVAASAQRGTQDSLQVPTSSTTGIPGSAASSGPQVSAAQPPASPRVTPAQPQRNTSDPFGRGTALAIPFASLQSEAPYITGANHAPGSFERFLADLQSDVSTAIVRSRADEATATLARREVESGLEEMRPLLDDIEEVASDMPASDSVVPANESDTTSPTQSSATPSANDRNQFSFFRSYRFSPVSLDELATPSNGTPRNQQSTTAAATSDAAAASQTASVNSAVLGSTDSAGPTSSTSNTEMEDVVMEGTAEAATVTSAQNEMAQSAEVAQGTATSDANGTQPTTQGASAARPSNRQVVPMLLVGVRSASLQAMTGSEGQTNIAARPHTPASQRQHAHPLSSAQDDFSSTAGAVPATPLAQNTAASRPRESSGFILWILGGLYPPNHPIVIAPSLLGDDAMSYDELLRLAEVLGSVKPPTVTNEEIKNSTLKTIKASAIPELQLEGLIRDITAERCLVCLEDYEDEEDIRILNCRHCFHQPCVDTWLSTGANTCPACRTVGVEKATPTESGGPAAEGLPV